MEAEGEITLRTKPLFQMQQGTVMDTTVPTNTQDARILSQKGCDIILSLKCNKALCTKSVRKYPGQHF
jgi:hypothetical protein